MEESIGPQNWDLLTCDTRYIHRRRRRKGHSMEVGKKKESRAVKSGRKRRAPIILSGERDGIPQLRNVLSSALAPKARSVTGEEYRKLANSIHEKVRRRAASKVGPIGNVEMTTKTRRGEGEGRGEIRQPKRYLLPPPWRRGNGSGEGEGRGEKNLNYS